MACSGSYDRRPSYESAQCVLGRKCQALSCAAHVGVCNVWQSRYNNYQQQTGPTPLRPHTYAREANAQVCLFLCVIGHICMFQCMYIYCLTALMMLVYIHTDVHIQIYTLHIYTFVYFYIQRCYAAKTQVNLQGFSLL